MEFETYYTLEEQDTLGRIIDDITIYNEDDIILLGEEIAYDIFLEEITGGSVKTAVRNVSARKRRVDRKVSNAIDKTYDAAIDGGRKQEIKSIREDLMRGRGKPSTVLKRAVKIALSSAAVTTAAGAAALAPAIALISFVVSTARRKNISAKEKNRLIYEMQQELIIVEEKIKDAESDNDRKKKYQYMRIKMELEKNIRQLRTQGKITPGDPKKKVINATAK